jgi:hypothetical protein
MACDITKGKALLECKDAVSGLKAVYLSNFGEFDFTAGTGPGASLQEIASISGATGADFYKYELKNSGNTFQQDITSSRDNGTTFFTQTLNFVLTKLSAEMEFQVKMMAWGRPQIVVEANSGTFFLMGREHGCEISGNSQIQGTMDSLNGYTLTAVGMEKEPIFYLQSSAITFVTTNVSTNNI